jgi:diguanylate cyclase (GGDEF)-like protein/PAS domain S-box-containing protein
MAVRVNSTEGETEAAQPPRFTRPRILVVDDEPLLCESIKATLGAQGYEMQFALSGQAALAEIRRQLYDLVLLDLHMPDMHGIQVLDFIRDRNLEALVIVISGDSSIESAIAALRSGAHDFLRKPYQPEELLKRVENSLKRRRLEQENAAILRQLEQSERWHRYLVNSSPDLIYTLDQEGRFTFVNDRAHTLLGYSKDELIGQPWWTLVHEEDLAQVRHLFNERRTGERAVRNVEVRLQCKDRQKRPRLIENRLVHVELNAMGMYEGGDTRFPGRFLGTYGVAKDISDRKRAEEMVTYQAYHDLLTGLPNRVLFKDHLGLAIAQARRSGGIVAVMVLDLDRFKLVNENLGHVVGDELLLNAGSRLRSCLRQGDTLARLGGDEFALLLPQVNSAEDVTLIAHKALAALDAPFHIDNHELFAKASIGISLFPRDGETIGSLLKNADVAMYHAKAKGRNRYELYSHTMNAAGSERLSMESELRRAIERKELVAFYQPQIDVKDGRVSGFEALARWRHPTRGLLAPSEFIAVAEETGLIVPIGEWMLDAACAQARRWRQQLDHTMRVAVNLSALQVEQADFVEGVLQILAKHGLDASALELEITESAVMKDMENTIAKLRSLSAKGVKIAIDDFGTGYSSLNYLKKFPIHTIKIDKSFVQDIAREHSAPIVTAIAAMAKGLRLNLVAEGVETERQMQYLSGLGCDQVQGFLYSPPLDVDEASYFLQHKLTAEEFRTSFFLGGLRPVSPPA